MMGRDRHLPKPTKVPSLGDAVLPAVAFLFSHPVWILFAIAAWGLGTLTLQEHILWGALSFLGLVAEPAFFGLAAKVGVERQKVTWALLGEAIRRYWIGILFISIFFSLPLLILVPLLALAVGLAEATVPIAVLALGPIAVPTIAAMWSLVLRGQNPIEAVAGGFLHLRSVWVQAIALGVGYTAVAHLLRPLRAFLLANGALPLGIALDVVWAGAEGLFRLVVLFWLYRRYLPNDR